MMATLSSGASAPSSSFNEFFSSGSLFGARIEPEVSIRNTRFARGRDSRAGTYPLMPICISCVAPFHGVGIMEACTANGVSGFSGGA